MEILKKNQRGYSYLSVIVTIMIIQIISLTFTSVVLVSNNVNELSNKNIISTQIADSFLELTEAELNNNIINLNYDSVLNVYNLVSEEANKYNDNNDIFHVEVYFQCDNNCTALSNPDFRKFNKNYLPNEIEVSTVIKYEISDAVGKRETRTTELSRLVVIGQ